MLIRKVTDPEFSRFGKVVEGYDFGPLLAKLVEVSEKPADHTIYVPSDLELEKEPVFTQLQDRAYGGMPIQIGYCNGNNYLLNCLEYHRDSEINIAADDAILILGRMEDIKDGKYDTANVEAFLVPKGCAVEVYATSLHYAPCTVEGTDGFRVIVVLPRGTNTDKPDYEPACEEDRWMTARNKWLLAHPEAPEAASGAYIGLQDKEAAGPVGLATIGFGQGVAVTPIQLITAICSLGNDGKLMRPRLVKEILDSKGEVVEENSTEVMRQTVSKETADEMKEIMEFVATDGGGGAASVEGYRVGATTGTANKAVAGGYSKDTYSSCLGMAPMSDPKLTVLVIVDSPKGIKYGSVTAAPAVGTILEKSMKYMNITPDGEEEVKSEEKVEVPNVVGKGVDVAIGKLAGKSLNYDMDKSAENDNFIVVKQYPSAGTKVKKGTKVYLYNE